jgi:hypothetical protein
MVEQTIKLYYFNGTARGETARLCFLLGGVKFEDVRLTGPEFGEKK